MEFLGALWTEILLRPMVNILTLFYDLLWDNFGLSIIFFTVAVRLLLVPLTVKQTRQMKAMQALQPKMKAIQQKYSDKKDPESRRKSSQEVMKLYREAGVNPVGCLGPLVLQLPIWITMYRAMFKTVPPTPEGMADLSNLLYAWNPSVAAVPINSQFLGMDLVNLVQSVAVPFNFILPVLVGGSLWVQQRMTMTPAADERMQQQNQIMLWMLPIMFGFFAFQFPVGLAVYIFFSTLIGIAITYFISGQRTIFGRQFGVPEPAPAAVNVAETEEASSKENEGDGSEEVHSEDGGRGDRHRSRSSRRKQRRRRNRRS